VSEQRIPELECIRTLDQFYFFLDRLSAWMPELRVWEWQGEVYHERTDYVRLMQFYYYFNQPELEVLQSPIDPVRGLELTPISRWLREFAVEWGAFLDTPESASRLETYKFAPEYAYQDYKGGDDGIENYKSFNEWFSRTFKDIDIQRPVAQPDNDRIIAFPAESTFVGQWAVSTKFPEQGPMKATPPSIVVKHISWPIPELLQSTEHGESFEGGILMHSFLNVQDYHRQHAPASGKVVDVKFIPGQVYLDVDLQILDEQERATSSGALANAVIARRHLDAEDPTGYQFIQCRGLMVLETRVGTIAVLPMGMAQVSSVCFVKPGTEDLIRLTDEEKRGRDYDEQVELLNERCREAWLGQHVQKGDMISSFLFGGSDIVVVFDRQSNVDITAKVGVHYPVRSQMAVSNTETLG
jgi:phosphatidylserine decarboxylase